MQTVKKNENHNIIYKCLGLKISTEQCFLECAQSLILTSIRFPFHILTSLYLPFPLYLYQKKKLKWL